MATVLRRLSLIIPTLCAFSALAVFDVSAQPESDRSSAGLPERYQGRYIPTKTWDAIVSGEIYIVAVRL